ncbi:uncharacterized protein LOC111056858 isoform X2 [Nilaparvata lugens]|uniref:uncharacterized protein LOC111056858 isoform X2 n=1 Tax=Nilaparvata lugens TaxID=108931 RepID=UPI00193DC8D9|nr:uncharacterized protein LOC111056858 isoform X2 [Nilaparvata lugens]
MAPGLNGGGRPTGTVPKTKTHNESSSREQSTHQPHRRDFSFSHMNNNLAPADWQALADYYPVARSRKESNNSSTRYPEPNEIQDEAAVCPEIQWSPPALQSQVNYCSEDEHARWEDKRRKSNNKVNPPDQVQMNRRFVEICDYINQTSSLMDTRQPSGNSVAENGLPESNFTLAGATAVSPDTMHQRNFPSQPTGSVPKSSDSTLRRNELKMKMEESQRKISELREQSVIMALKRKAQEQLKEAQTAQRAWLTAASLTQAQGQPPSAAALSDANIQDSLNNLQRFYDGRNEIGEMIGCNPDCTSEVVHLQNKLKELQLKKSKMDQKILQYASSNTNMEPGDVGGMANGGAIPAGDQNIEDKIAELAVLREQLSRMQGVIAAIPALNTSQVTVLPS